VLDMHMRPRLFTSEKEEAIPADAEDRRTHGLSIPECCFSDAAAQGDATALALALVAHRLLAQHRGL
jgi:hypothetical protein